MSTFAPARPAVNSAPTPDPRESWPAWTDESRWELGPEPDPAGDDEPRPTAGPDFEPCPEDDAEWLGLRLALEDEDDDPAYVTMSDGRITDLDAWPRGVC